MLSIDSQINMSYIDKTKDEIIQQELMGALIKEYKLNVKSIHKNEQSTDKNVYEIQTDRKEYIVKIYTDFEHTKSMINLHNKLTSSKISIPEIIPTKENNYYIKLLRDYYVVTYSYIDGKPIECNEQTGRFDKNTIIYIAKELRKIHTITSNNNIFNLPLLPFENKSCRKSVLHFDLTRNNILTSCNKKISIIDFDDAKFGDSVCDIAILISNLFFSKTRGVDLDGMNEFIDEYYINNMDLKNKEKLVIKKYALEWIKYILYRNEFDTSTTESFEERYKLIENNL